MNLDSRPLAPHPYAQALPQLPSFTLTSENLQEGVAMPRDFSGEGANSSPQLSWSGAPAQTASYVLSCFDPDAPTPSGYWHWTVVDIPPSVTSLPLGAGADDATIQAVTEGRAVHIRNDTGVFAYDGPFPPAGDREHRYVFAVHALKIPSLELDPATATNATVHFMSLFNGLARATLTATYRR